MPIRFSLARKLFFALCAFHLVINIFWLALNTAPILWDQAGHTRLAIEFARYFQGTLTKDTPLISISSYYPPITHLVVSTFVIVFGPSVFITAFPITLYFLMLLFGLFLLTKRLTQNEWIALFTVTFFSFFPIIYENSRSFLLEIPLLTWLVFAWYFLSRTDYFNHWREVFLFSLMCVGVLLTKWIGLAFLCIPLAFTLLIRWKKGWHSQHTAQLILYCLIVASLTLPWYVSNFDRLLEIGRLASQGEITDPQSLLSLENIVFYFQLLLNFQLTLWPATAAIIASIAYWIQRKNPYKIFLSIFLITGYLFFTFISNKDIRYTTPLLPVLAYICGYMIVKWWNSKQYLGVVLLGTSLGFLLLQFIVLSFHLLPTYQQAWYLGPLGWIDYVNTGDIVVKHPQQDSTPNEEILNYLTLKHRNEPLSVMIGVDHPHINPSTLDLVITLNKYWQVSLEAPFDITEFSSETEMTVYLERFEYVLIPTGEVGPDAVRHKKALQQIQRYVLLEHPENFKLQKSFTSSEGGEILLLSKV